MRRLHVREVINEAIGRGRGFSWIKEAGGVDAAMTELARALASIRPIRARALRGISSALIAAHECRRSRRLAAGSKHDRELADRIKEASAAAKRRG